jgi:hypothetical protein
MCVLSGVLMPLKKHVFPTPVRHHPAIRKIVEESFLKRIGEKVL